MTNFLTCTIFSIGCGLISYSGMNFISGDRNFAKVSFGVVFAAEMVFTSAVSYLGDDDA